MDELREKCPWDKEQTMDSLKILTIEESYELTEAIDEKNYEEIKNELGDLLLHIIFYSKIASEKSKFDFNDVIKSISQKLINRHPHVFEESKNIVNKLVLTRVECEINGDIFYPQIDLSDWKEISQESFKRDSENEYDFRIETLVKT